LSTLEILKKPKFGKLLRKIRGKKKMSIRELARRVGVDHTYLSQIELGKVGPPVGSISMAIARILESPELMELAEYALARQLLITELQRRQVYAEMPPAFREELKISDNEWKEITDMCSKLIPRLLAAKERREKPSEWQPMSPEEEKKRFSKSWN
jgi:transcriptional regulator with XRE-family HTH domain